MKTKDNIKLINESSHSTARSLIKPRSIQQMLKELDPPQRLAIAVLLNLLQEVKRYAIYRQHGKPISNVIPVSKPLAEIRWFLTSPDAGELFAESLGLSMWSYFHDKSMVILDRAELLNPHLASSDPDYFAAYEVSQLTDNDTLDDLVIHDSIESVKPDQTGIIPAVNLTFPFYSSYRTDDLGACNTAPSKPHKNHKTPQQSILPFIQCELFPDLFGGSPNQKRSI